MKHPAAVAACLLGLCTLPAFGAEMARPLSGPVEILKIDQVKTGMMATAWTVFNGSEPEAVPVEILGVMKNVWGPRQHIILGKMGGKAARTSVAAGMSGSPVYYEGKLMGAVSLRIGAFSPDAICGITPIELMLEINEFDEGRPSTAQAPTPGRQAAMPGSGGLYLTPIHNPLTFTGF